MNYLNPAGLRVVVSGRINPLIRVQLEAVVSHNLESNCLLQAMPSIVGYFENVSIGEPTRRMQDPNGIAR
jgi:hypothetical protein